jgi:hypothetical protein
MCTFLFGLDLRHQIYKKQNKDYISLHWLLQTLKQNTKGKTTLPDVAKRYIDFYNSRSFNHLLQSCEV